ncbi:MAG: DUF4124 domain-containing protein [Gammaproteobacteria bacterium]|jgi:hypothetical protein
MENGEGQAEVSGTLNRVFHRSRFGHQSSSPVRTTRRAHLSLSLISSRGRRCPPCLRLAAAALLLQSCCVAAAIYKWKDQDGGVHYSDHPPPGQTAQSFTVAPPPPPDPDAAARRERRNRLLEIYSEDRQREEAQREAARKKQEKRKRNCDRARRQLAAVRKARFLYEDTSDPKNPMVLSSKERAQATQKLEQQVRTWCD